MDMYEKSLSAGEPLYSYHSFIFPFEWHSLEPIDPQNYLKHIGKQMLNYGGDWERRSSWRHPKTIAQYNEANYFYEFARNVLYDSGEEDSLQYHYYNTVAEQGCKYIIELQDGSNYQLEVDDIVLSFFDTGVGIISFHLLNKEASQSSPNDILKINALGRRIYPPFFDVDQSAIGTQDFFEYDNWDAGLSGCKSRNEIAKEIRIEKDGERWIADDFSNWISNQRLEQEPGLIKQLIPEPLLHKMKMTPVLDDRMFTVCWYGNKKLVENIKGTKPDSDYQNNEWWYQYVFVDGAGKTCQNDRMTQELLKKSTNDRWAEYGTYYGVSRYSFVVLTDHISVNAFAAIVSSHVQTIYYKIAMIGLLQRASILRFSEDIASITKHPVGDKQAGQLVNTLNRQYIRFVNSIYFREITAQEQGIELYDMLQEQMRLPEQISSLQYEIQELHQYTHGVEEDNRNKKLDKLTYMAALFIVPSFILSYLGIGNINMKENWISVSIFCILGAGFSLLAVIAKKSGFRILWIVLTAILLVLVLSQYTM